MSELYKGFRVYRAPASIVATLRTSGSVEPWDGRMVLYPNMYVELKNEEAKKDTVLGRVDPSGRFISHIHSTTASGLEPRNLEQAFALDALMDSSIPVVVLSGKAGTGKTILALAAALELGMTGPYNRVVITRPMSQVGKYKMGSLPGEAHEKFGPYLINYQTNLEQLIGGGRRRQRSLDDMLHECRMEMVPLQFFRGASFNNTLVIADEMQVCDRHETLTVGSRIGEGSRLVIMGDLSQRDESISREKTGLFRLFNDSGFKKSHLVAAVELQKCERSETARLFADVLEE